MPLRAQALGTRDPGRGGRALDAGHEPAGARDRCFSRRALAEGDIDQVFIEDERFHQAFSVFAGREGVWNTVLAAKARLGRFVRLFGKPERLPIVIEEHLAVIDALDQGDDALAVQRLSHHLDMVFHMLEQLPDQYRPYLSE